MRTKHLHTAPPLATMNIGFLSLPLLILLISCEPKSREESSSDNTFIPLAGVEQSLESAKQEIEPPIRSAATPLQSMVHVQSTNQAFNQTQPWTKNKPSFEQGFAIYVGNGKFLTTANLVNASNFVELVSSDRSQFAPALVQTIDEEANLALLSLKKHEDTKLIETLIPITIGNSPSLNEEFELWQFNGEGIPIVTKGILQSTSLNTPYTNNALFTIYDIKSATTPVMSNSGIPIISNNKLVGVSLKCNTGEQQVFALTQPIIKQFLEKAKGEKPYIGFPQIGIETDYLVDPVFREYLKISPKGGGVFVSKLIPRSAAEAAGIRQGDVLESINGIEIDARGLVKDETLGPVHYSMLLRDTRQQGDSVSLGMRRDGTPFEAKVTLTRNAIDKDIISRPPAKQQPDYIIEGGIIFQAMTYSLLEAVSPEGNSKASMEMLEAINQKEDYVKQGRGQIILITNVLPTQAALGYSSLAGSILQKVNGTIVKDLKHLAQLLDQPSKDDIIQIETNKPPYVIYLSQKIAKQGNDIIQTNGIPVLRHLAK